MADDFDYRLRPGKSVVRKVVFEWIYDSMPPRGDSNRYREDVRYIGFGAAFFVDFAHAFKQLRIKDMVSLEENVDRYQRALYNKPYSSVSVLNQLSTDYLTDLPTDTRKYVAWMDYTGSLSDYMLEDASIMASKFASGSFFVITLNAWPNFEAVKSRDNTPEVRQAKLDAFRDMIGDGFPDDIEAVSMTTQKFPAVASRVLVDRIRSDVRRASGSRRRFVPALVFLHKDGAPMLTIAGAIADEHETDAHGASGVKEISRCFRERLRLHAPPEINEVRTPVLTPKEIRALDTRLPDSPLALQQDPSSLTPEQVRNGTAGVAITGAEWDAYLRYHSYYPVYSELSPWF